MRKNIIKTVFVFVSISLAATSCSSFIEEDTSTQFTEDRIENSSEGAQTLVTGVYSKWIYDMFCWGYFPRMLEFDADYISGPDWYFNKFGAGNFDGESDLVDALWKGCYNLIYRANYAERQINAMTNLTKVEKDNAIGELEFQKAFSYFLLVRAYGQIPIQNETGENNDALSRQPIATVYDYIIKNLEDAASKMYKNTDAAYQAGHVNAGSAAGLLAKVYATMAAASMPEGTEITIRTGKAYEGTGDSKKYADLVSETFRKTAVTGYEQMNSDSLYEKAKVWAGKVINGEYGKYDLLPYDQLWKKAHATDSEFMFSIGSVSGNDTYKNAIHTMYEGYMKSQGSDFIAQGGWVGCTRHWYDLFNDDDYRIVSGVKHRWRASDHETSNLGFYYPNKGPWQTYRDNGLAPYNDGVNYYYSMDSQCLAFTTKYMDVTDDATANADANWPFLRFADVLLIYAEALNETGDQANAKIYLDMILDRSNGKVYSGYDLTNKNGMRSAIIEERAKEFGCEADRRWDLIRWGIYLDAMNALEGSDDAGVQKNRQTKHLLFPIPKTEISTNPNINENNPGWQ